LDKHEILRYLTSHKKEFYKKYGVTKIGLFGSYAIGREHPQSDIDIAVEMIPEKKNLRSFFGLKRELETAFRKNVDLGIESTLKPAVKAKVLEEMIYV